MAKNVRIELPVICFEGGLPKLGELVSDPGKRFYTGGSLLSDSIEATNSEAETFLTRSVHSSTSSGLIDKE